MSQVDFTFGIGDTVLIVDAKPIIGRVTGMKLEIAGQMFRVCWWNNGHRVEDWLFDWEITKGKS